MMIDNRIPVSRVGSLVLIDYLQKMRRRSPTTSVHSKPARPNRLRRRLDCRLKPGSMWSATAPFASRTSQRRTALAPARFKTNLF